MRGENLRSVYVLLFLHVVFFFLQYQSQERFAEAFAMHPAWILNGEIWRAATYVFLSGSFIGSLLIGFFFLMMILYILGTAIEDDFGTAHFLTLFVISALVPALVSFMTWPPRPILGAFFVYYTLMVVYGHRYGDAVFYLLIIPVKARWLAWAAVAFLAIGVVASWRTGVPIAAGVAAAWGYYRIFMAGGRRLRVPSGFKAVKQAAAESSSRSSVQANLNQFRETKRISEAGTEDEKKARIETLEQGITPGVNICPPVDFKPDAEDQFCARCEGFNECSARWLKSQLQNESK